MRNNGRIRIVGIDESTNILEFICAIEKYVNNDSNVKVYENVNGSARAYADLLKTCEKKENYGNILNVFSKYGCFFMACWDFGESRSNYRAVIDMSNVSFIESLKIIMLANKLKKEDKKSRGTSSKAR